MRLKIEDDRIVVEAHTSDEENELRRHATERTPLTVVREDGCSASQSPADAPSHGTAFAD